MTFRYSAAPFFLPGANRFLFFFTERIWPAIRRRARPYWPIVVLLASETFEAAAIHSPIVAILGASSAFGRSFSIAASSPRTTASW